MAASFIAVQSMSMARKEDFADTSLIPEAFGRHIVSRCLPPDRHSVDCSVHAEQIDGSGITFCFTSRIGNLNEPAMLAHKFFFVDREETRERLHVVTPEEPEVSTSLLIHLGASERDYCHACVYDAENRLLAVHAVVFDGTGRTVPYPFTDRYVSPLNLGKAELRETIDDNGRRALRFVVGLTGLTEPTRVDLAWQAVGRIYRKEFCCTPVQPEVYDELPLDDNPLLAHGDWVVIAVDEHDRFLAQTLVTLQSAG